MTWYLPATQNTGTIVIVHSVGPLITEPWIESPRGQSFQDLLILRINSCFVGRCTRTGPERIFFHECDLPSTLGRMDEARGQAAEKLLEHFLPHTQLVPGHLLVAFPQPPHADMVFAKRTRG
jgi:hypothetical protein